MKLAAHAMSASLIGRFGSSAFKPSTTTFQTIHEHRDATYSDQHNGLRSKRLQDSKATHKKQMQNLTTSVLHPCCMEKIARYEKALKHADFIVTDEICLLYTSPSPRDRQKSRMPSSA